MILENFKLIVSLFTGDEFKDIQEIENKTILLIRKTLRTEILFVGFHLFTGLVLSAVLIFSLIQVGQALQVHLSHFVNGAIIEVLSFSGIAVICLVFLIYIFKKRSPSAVFENKKNQDHALQIDLQTVGLQFISGFIQGLQSKKDQNKT